MDWFLYDRGLRHERVKSLHVLKHVRGVIRALQTPMMVLLIKIACNVNLKTLSILAKRLILDPWLGSGRVSALQFLKL